MDDQSKLTQSGLLYEGNYLEWEHCLWVSLELLEADIDVADIDVPFGKLNNGTLIITFIGLLAIPRLLLTMSESAKTGSRPHWRKHLLHV